MKTPDNKKVDFDKICFVLAPLSEKGSEIRNRSDNVFNHIIHPAASALGFEAVRADHLHKPGLITQQVIRYILKSKIVVADLTGYNPNVFYELAIRHSFRRPVIQMIMEGQRLPFDIADSRTIQCNLDLDSVAEARDNLIKHGSAILNEGVEVDSPVSIALGLEELKESNSPQSSVLVEGIFNQISSLNDSFQEVKHFLSKSEDMRAVVPGFVRDSMSEILQKYSQEIELLQSIRQAGIIGVYKRREAAIKAFSKYIDAETTEIVIIGSSLKGLLQKSEYSEFAAKIRFKIEQKFAKVKFLLTHPILADFRANQEQRRPTEIGDEIIKTLDVLKSWNVPPEDIKLYLGTPTCFAIKTTTKMLINPYPYSSKSYDSPCLILEFYPAAGAQNQYYFYDEFKTSHFEAWDSEMAVNIKNQDIDHVISLFRDSLKEYSVMVNEMIKRGKEI
jgi:hypothetical protein